MNSMLPAPRDLPPRRRTQIRVELQRTIAQEPQPRRARHAPLIAALAAVAVLAGVVLLVPWRTSTQPAVAVSTTPPPASTPASTTTPAPVLPGLSAAQLKEIEAGCSAIAGRGPAKLFNLVTDEAGKFALLYNHDTALDCTIGGKAMPYNSGLAGLQDWQWLPGELSVDLKAGSAGGSAPGGKAEYRGERGYQAVAGRISSKVAKVTYTDGDRTVDAVLANGTYIARIVHSDTWKIPADTALGTVQAYDANGTLIGESAKPGDNCHATPEGKVIGARPATDPTTCLPAVRWR
jgi:hypothetical protein